MITIDVRSTMREAIADIRAQVADVNRAAVMAMNRTAEQTRTQAGREIRAVYNLKLAAIRKASKIVRASRQRPTAELSFSGRRIGLIEFSARERTVRTARGPRRAVSVQVLRQGGRKVVQGGFVGTRRWTSWQDGAEQAHRGIFKRVGKERYPIRYLRSISIPVAVSREAIARVLLRFADERFDKNFDDAIRFVLRG